MNEVTVRGGWAVLEEVPLNSEHKFKVHCRRLEMEITSGPN